jgi:Ca2+-transporting ATPase
MVFLTLTSLQLGVALGIRARQGVRSNVFLLLAVAGSVGLALAGVYAPPLRELLETTSLSWTEALAAIAIGALGWLAVRLDLLLKKASRQESPSPAGRVTKP